jgi:hypothetical protein
MEVIYGLKVESPRTPGRCRWTRPSSNSALEIRFDQGLSPADEEHGRRAPFGGSSSKMQVSPPERGNISMENNGERTPGI